MGIKQIHDSPIFIHSLFRSGSTYLFNVFRRSDEPYFCYQEPMHELAFFSKNDPDKLLDENGPERETLLRHSPISGNYFKELYETWAYWNESVTERVIYDAYFNNDPSTEMGISYWSALIYAATSRPVFQECRTSGRISGIREALGGYHIYLWRNPWDQWWSYKVTPYFDTANQLIIHSSKAPLSAKKLCAELTLPNSSETDLNQAFIFYANRPLTSEQSYLVFYLLWCLALRSGMEHADLLVNIDRLSSSSSYRDNILGQLQDQADINNIDFSDCHVPQAYYTERDIIFFRDLEERVHRWLKADGWTEDDLKAIQLLRKEYLSTVSQSYGNDTSVAALVEQSSRARELARRFETEQAEGIHQLNEIIKQVEDRAQQAEVRAQQAEVRAQQAEVRAQQAATKLETVYASTSWRITAPIREFRASIHNSVLFLRTVLKSLLKSVLVCCVDVVFHRYCIGNRLNFFLKSKLPKLHRSLRHFAQRMGVINSPNSAEQLIFGDKVLHNKGEFLLTSREREIYLQIKNTIEHTKIH